MGYALIDSLLDGLCNEKSITELFGKSSGELEAVCSYLTQVYKLAMEQGFASLEVVTVNKWENPEYGYYQPALAEKLRNQYGIDAVKTDSVYRHFSDLLLMVIDGWTQDDLLKKGQETYNTAGFDDMEKMKYLLLWYGSLMIQVGVPLQRFGEKLKAMYQMEDDYEQQ